MKATQEDYWWALDNGYQGTMEEFLADYEAKLKRDECVMALREKARQLATARYMYRLSTELRVALEIWQGTVLPEQKDLVIECRMKAYDKAVPQSIFSEDCL